MARTNKIEPLWWRDARLLRAAGETYQAIANKLHRSEGAVNYACDDRYRRRKRALENEKMRRKRQEKMDEHSEQEHTDEHTEREHPDF